MQEITPCLWFDANAEEAVRFYASVFKNSKIDGVTRYGGAGPGPAGSVMTIAFRLGGRRFFALNGGPHFKFSPAISFIVHCENQREVDHYWKKLGAGGQAGQCGWITDRYGVSWQIVPRALGVMLRGKNARRTQSVMRALFQMKKLEIAVLRRAYASPS